MTTGGWGEGAGVKGLPRRLVQAALAISVGLLFACASVTTPAQSFLKIDAEATHHWVSHRTDFSFYSGGDWPNLAIAPRSTREIASEPVRTVHASREVLFPLIVEASKRHGIEPAWALAVIELESSFDAKAISPKGAIGLMQLMPGTAKRYGLSRADDLFCPEINIGIGVRHLKALLDRHQNNWPIVLAAYNAGENAVAKRGRRTPAYRETLLYVSAALARVEAHRQLLNATDYK